MVIKELSKYEFNEFAKKWPYTPYHTIEYADTMEEEGYKYLTLGLYDNETLKAASIIMYKNVKNFKYAYVSRGYLIDYTNYDLLNTFTLELKKYLSSKGIIAIKINPLVVKNIYDSNYNLVSSNPDYNTIFNNLINTGYKHMGYNDSFEGIRPRHEAIINIGKDYFTLFGLMHKNFRTKVRAAEASGIRIYKGNKEDLKYLYDEAKGKYPRGFNYYEKLYDNFGDNIEIYYAKIDFDVYLKKNQADFLDASEESETINKEILSVKNNKKLLNKKMVLDKTLNASKAKLSNAIDLMAKHPEGRIIATLLITKNNNIVNVMIDAFDKGYTSFNAKHLIIWKLMEKYSKEGYKYFNLGGIASDNSEKYAGLNDYKLGFGAQVYEYIGDFEYVINKPLYLIYKNTLFKK